MNQAHKFALIFFAAGITITLFSSYQKGRPGWLKAYFKDMLKGTAFFALVDVVTLVIIILAIIGFAIVKSLS